MMKDTSSLLFSRLWIVPWLTLALVHPSLTAAEPSPALSVLFRGDAVTELAPHGLGNIYAPSVVVDGDLWRMWYGGQGKDGHDRIHYAESADSGRSWVKRGVVLENGSANHVNDPSVLRVSGKWFMFYTVAERGTEDAIALAVSPDGLRWEKHGVVLAPGPKGSWDSRLVGRLSVLHENGQFRMWYDGQPTKEDRPRLKLEGARAVGLATSSDGMQWQRHSTNSVFQRGAGAVDIARVENGYLLLYEGQAGVGAAVSGDGVVWKDRGLVTHLSGSDSDRYGQVTPHLVHNGNAWQIFFGAASRKTWDGNILARVPLAALP
jgi:sucrose-6-phosphate hydrolase SacC (GH32 family)